MVVIVVLAVRVRVVKGAVVEVPVAVAQRPHPLAALGLVLARDGQRLDLCVNVLARFELTRQKAVAVMMMMVMMMMMIIIMMMMIVIMMMMIMMMMMMSTGGNVATTKLTML